MYFGVFMPISVHAVTNDVVPQVQIAFLADIHFHDIHADIGIGPVGESQPSAMRSMNAQLSSTRLFNENYYVLLAALDDLVARGVNLVALPGDFTDDGQPINVIALERILSFYTFKHGMRFFTITGNHDPVRPYTTPSGKKDFLTLNGSEVAVYSPSHKMCRNRNERNDALVCHDGVKAWGYQEIMETMAAHGFSPQPSYKLFETPFGSHAIEKRGWRWCDEASNCVFMPDASYLVEPIDGVWLLAIDANVYAPKGSLASGEFLGSSSAGYNALLSYKPELIAWIRQVVYRARVNGKRLIAFSHFPMADFYDNTQEDIVALFGEDSMQLARMPTANTTETLANTGLRLHMAGHMHLFDVHGHTVDSGNTLVNVQVPSLAAYQPGYSIVSLYPNMRAKVETVVLSEVEGFDRLFPHYHKELAYRKSNNLSDWEGAILQSDNYAAFTDAHLQSVVSGRYLKKWPAVLTEFLHRHTLGEIFEKITCQPLDNTALNSGWSDLPGTTLAYDYYRIRNASVFANLDGRLSIYQRMLGEHSHRQCNGMNIDGHAMVVRLTSLILSGDNKEDIRELWIEGL